MSIETLPLSPASFAIARRCSTELVEAPIAMSTVSAFLNAAAVIISEGRTPFPSSFITASPVSFASARRCEYTAGMVPFPGSAMPSASHRQFIEFAVNMPEHEPQVGQAPPDTNIEGMFTLAAAMSMPGIILSQLPINTAAWNACARMRISALSAIISREGREYLIPA